MSKTIKIHSFNYNEKKNSFFVEFTESVNIDENVTIHNKHSVSYKYKPHKDLRDALNRLIPHLVRITEEPGAFEMLLTKHYEQAAKLTATETSTYQFSRFFVSGATVRDSGVLLKGGKRIKTHVQNVNTPFIHYEQTTYYADAEQLQADIEDLLGEVELYMKGKFSPPEQQSLPFITDASEPVPEETTKTAVAEKPAPAKKRKQSVADFAEV